MDNCTASLDPSVRLNLTAHAQEVTAVKFRNTGNMISSSNDNNLVQWHLNTSDVRTYTFSEHTERINDIDCSKNGKLIASASHDKTIRLWMPSLKGACREIRAHMKPVTSVHFAHTGKKLLSGSTDKSLKLWDVNTQKFLHSMVGHNHFVNCARFANESKLAVSCAEDKTVKLWDVDNQQCIHTISLRASVNKIAVHGKYVACAMQTGSVRIYDYMDRRLVQHYTLNDNITSVDWHPTGKFLLAGAMNGITSVVDILEGRPIYQLHGLGGAITCCAFSPTGDTFATGGSNRHILIWDWDTSEILGANTTNSVRGL